MSLNFARIAFAFDARHQGPFRMRSRGNSARERRRIRIVDVMRKPAEATAVGLHEGALERIEERRVGFRIVERLAGRIERRDARPPAGGSAPALAAVKPLGDPFAHCAVLVRRGAHERDLRIVPVEIPAPVFLRHRIEAAEIDHIERADGADIWEARADHGAQSVRAGAQHAIEEEVADLCRGDVDETDEQPAIRELLHGAPAGSGGVETRCSHSRREAPPPPA
jgi:hypothetical protein